MKVKPDASTAVVNGQMLKLEVPVMFKGKTAFISEGFINEVFQSGLDQTFAGEKKPHPLNSLSANEINKTVEIINSAADYRPTIRFTEISLREPPKEQVWKFVMDGTIGIDAGATGRYTPKRIALPLKIKNTFNVPLSLTLALVLWGISHS